MLNPSTLAILKQSVPALEEHGETITARFYNILFKRYPELTNIFNLANQINGNQAKALANAIFAYANFAETPEKLMPAVSRIANKHASLNIQAEHYPMVGESLLSALSEVLELPMTHEIIQGWGDAYEALATVFIAYEKQLYSDNAEKPGGWDGFREFVIEKIEPETSMINSFYLMPKDKKPLASFNPGQYVSIKLDIPDHPTQELRQYSLSDSPEESHYRISVKAEPGAPEGTVSNYLHKHKKEGDTVLLSPPCGDFVFKENTNAVLISGGVGITPLMSMLKAQLAAGNKGLTFIHCTQDSSSHCFKDELAQLQEKFEFSNFSVYQNQEGGDHHGLIDNDALEKFTLNSDVDYYFCGPFAFMVGLRQLLLERGVSEDRMNYEIFGPTLPLAK